LFAEPLILIPSVPAEQREVGLKRTGQCDQGTENGLTIGCAMRIVLWGTYDTGKPRIRIIKDGLRRNGIEVITCHSNVWSGIEDKTQVTGLVRKVLCLIQWFSRYPRLIYRYVKLPNHDAVLVGYLGHLDVLLLWPFARLRGKPVIWDAFLSLYSTIVEDRKLISRWNPLAIAIYIWEWLACRAANRIILDTKSHADYFIQKYGLKKSRVKAIFVGAEDTAFTPAAAAAQSTHSVSVLFYGQFIPLHGIQTIVEAARLTRDEEINWTLIGKGQEAARIKTMIDDGPTCRITWIEWAPYEQLREWIQKADICLGIFGTSDKAARVIPNKVFQVLLCGKPLVTRDSAATRELLSPGMPGIMLVPAGNPQALADAVKTLSHTQLPETLHQGLMGRITPPGIGKEWVQMIKSLIQKTG
jgi:glycosyltransferase involved in cell wall biosynthesis